MSQKLKGGGRSKKHSTTNQPAASASEAHVPAWASYLRSKRVGVFAAVSLLVALLFALLAAYPLAKLGEQLLYRDGQFVGIQLAAYLVAIPDLLDVLRTTLGVVIASAGLGMLIGAPLAWFNERTDASFGRLGRMLPLIPFVMPPVAGAVGWNFLLSNRSGYINLVIRWIGESLFGIESQAGPIDVQTVYGLVFVYAIYMVPFVYLLVSAGLRNMDASLEEQAQVSGLSNTRTLFKITLPSVAPSIMASLLLLAWFGGSLFAVPAILGGATGDDIISVRIVRLLRYTFPPERGAAIFLSLVIVALVGSAWVAQRRITGGTNFAQVSGKYSRATRVQLGRFRPWAKALFILYIVVAVVLPLTALALVALSGFWTSSPNPAEWSIDSFQIILDNRKTRESMLNSLWLGIIGATVAVLVSSILSVLFRQHRGLKVTGIIDALIKLPFAVPGVVIGVGFLLAFSGPPFNLHGTILILLFGLLVAHFPQGFVATDAALSTVGDDLIDAGRVSGLGDGRIYGRILLPLMRGGLIAGWSLVFIRIAGDLTVSALLAGISNPVVGFTLLEGFENGNYGELAALALVLTLGSIVVLAAAFSVGSRIDRRA